MTVPVIVEIIFRFIPSALLVFGSIEINLTAKYNKYIQFIAINTVYLFAGLLGQYMREKYKLEFSILCLRWRWFLFTVYFSYRCGRIPYFHRNAGLPFADYI